MPENQYDGHAPGCWCAGCVGQYIQHNGRITDSNCRCFPCQIFRSNTPGGSAIQVGPLPAGINPAVVARKPLDKLAVNAAYGKRGKSVATVNFCERCNTMGRSSAMGIMAHYPESHYGLQNAAVEICPGCYQDLKDFMAGKPVGAVKDQERPKAYNEPWTEPKSSPLDSLSDEDLAAAYLARVAQREGKELTDGRPQDS